MRSQDAPYLITDVMQNRATAKQAWSFVQEHWGNIEKLGGAFAGWAIARPPAASVTQKCAMKGRPFSPAIPHPRRNDR
jgi:hypothetical protein